MKFTIKQKTFNSLLSRVVSLANQKSQLPIAQNVRIECNSDIILITATDLDSFISCKCECPTVYNGATTVPAHMLYDIVKKTPSDRDIEFTQEDDFVTLKSGRSRYKLPCLSSDDFPSIPSGSFESSFSIESSLIVESIEKSLFAICNDDSRYYLTGLSILSNGNELKVSSTDGNRISRSTYKINCDNFSVIVPKKSAMEIKKIASNSCDVNISLSKSLIKIESADVEYVSRLIDGEFPDLDRVIPSQNNNKVIVETKSMIECLERISISANDKSKSIKLKITQNKIEITTQNGYEELLCNYDGNDILSGFNSSYLLDILKNIDNKDTALLFKDGSSPLLVNNSNSQYVLMPIRI